MKKSRFTDGQIIGELKQAEAGTPIPALCRTHIISSATFYKWRSKFGGMDASMMSRLKELEEENRRLKKMYAEAQMSADILKEALQRKWLGHLSAVRGWQNGRWTPGVPVSGKHVQTSPSARPASVTRPNCPTRTS